ncbi:hypothetical protein SUGI_0272350 [Cryptomeria japonica]|uniref:uncharacterized protein LOC131044594 n=1 Tax=Cryptomeria japonica TaxID=3369 RepID=UPI002408B619|nr:uncharacterized protein LOC131044594 [Cryptomeria japonica]XP_057833943.1 uncharacterized protein LOC131044594 [Cryptomeria japonica]XP_057833948.1 uncharacterized protein LOC131044594 [Cryptomeria japonica]XP_057833954.1 uncharacterized protein LOC131044594 [Cryptomeria japonica]XP_057833961.1 uncharacterized protein LOC131044594 [Cryptomeria japonica]XP_057833966.1 uncharacterized protein LOC131044594 [Cryptomeria japonica]GLJ16232.1 hypothetical protein SUGI_0272350 [Cryptomeria japonic
MNDYNSESPKFPGSHHTWNFPPPEEVPQDVDREAHWKHFDASVNAVSFGFVATAILISMFLVMAIFERFLRPRPSFSSVQNTGDRALVRAQMQLLDKLDHSSAMSSYTIGVSVVMPGQEMPTFIAHPVPLPCPREEVAWPCHEHGHYLGSCSLDIKSSPSNTMKSQENAAQIRTT